MAMLTTMLCTVAVISTAHAYPSQHYNPAVLGKSLANNHQFSWPNYNDLNSDQEAYNSRGEDLSPLPFVVTNDLSGISDFISSGGRSVGSSSSYSNDGTTATTESHRGDGFAAGSPVPWTRQVGPTASVLLRRNRRQAEAAMNLALDHTDRNGNDRPVGQPHGFADVRITGNDRDNYHGSGMAGVGGVAWRSRNNRHSVGVGATVDQYRGSFQGHRYRGRPNYGGGIGYRYRF